MLIIIRQKTAKNGNTFISAGLKGEFAKDVKDIVSTQNYDVKMTKSSGKQLPTQEGIYQVKVDLTKVWVDKRQDLKFPTLWISDPAVEFKFYKNLPTAKK